MLTLDQKVLIYRDMITLGCDARDLVSYTIFGRVRAGAYGLDSDSLEEVSAFYMEMHDKVQKVVESVREAIQEEVDDFKDTQELILEEENVNERT